MLFEKKTRDVSETMEGVICLSLRRESVISGNLGKDNPDKTGVEFENKIRCEAFSFISRE